VNGLELQADSLEQGEYSGWGQGFEVENKRRVGSSAHRGCCVCAFLLQPAGGGCITRRKKTELPWCA
jgi:hypothetical protein